MPPENQLDCSKTFNSQKDLVIKTIVPTIKQLLDPETYPVNENVIYQIIYRRHRSQRDTFRISKKTENERKEEVKRKHKNTRRSEVIRLMYHQEFI